MGADTKKRLAMYVHYDPKGEVRDYVVFCLQGLSAVVSDILVIVNGMLSDGSRKKLESIKLKVIERENKDFDFGAWKAGIEYLGYDNIAEYDELILTNNSYYGPIYPFSEMCSVMDAKDADFWGINMCPEMDPQLPRHIQSYWMVFRNKILKSDDWKIYWNTLPHFKNIWKAVLQGEAILTGYFENHGFKSAAFMSLDKYDRLIHDNPTIISDMQVMEDRCPIVKRKFFFASKVTESSFGNFIMDFHVKKLMNYLEKEIPGMADIIWDDLLKSQHLSKINDHLNLNFILSSALSSNRKTQSPIAVIMHICSDELVEYCRNYAALIPEYIDIVAVSDSESTQRKCADSFRAVPNNVRCLLQQGNGSDNAVLWVTCKKLIRKYDYICFVRAKKMSHSSGFMSGADLMEHCFSCLLYSNAFIKNVIETFGDNPRLGLLIPFTAMGGVNCNIANEWGEDYDNSKNMLREYFHIEDNELDKHPLVPFGGMFWVRAKALRTLIGYDWKHDDFPEGPLVNGNGLMTHTLDRLVSRLSQNDGFYTAFVAPGSYVNFYLGHLYFMNREIKSRLFDEIGSCQDLKLLRNLDDLHCDADSFSYWEKHRRKLELRYLGYKLLRRITVGDIRQEYKTKLLRLKIIRRSLKNRG